MYFNLFRVNAIILEIKKIKNLNQFQYITLRIISEFIHIHIDSYMYKYGYINIHFIDFNHIQFQ